jgi:uncharacterized protein YkwD
MIQRRFFIAALLMALISGFCFAQDDKPADGDYSSGVRADPDAEHWDIETLDTGRNAEYLSGLEKDVLLEMNKVRADPKKYAERYIKPMLANFQGNLYVIPGKISVRTNEGTGSVNDCINSLNRMQAVPALVPEQGLSLGARDHVQDTGKTGRTGHTGEDGSTLAQRISRYGKWGKYCGENIDYGKDTGREIVIHLLIDDGVSGRGHRLNIMNGRFTRAGVSAGPHKRYGYMCVIDYAQEYVSTESGE